MTTEGATPPQRVHPVTPWVLSIQMSPLILFAFVPALQATELNMGIILGAIGIAIVILIAIVIGQFLSWQRLTYYFDGEGDFRLDSGVLTRRQRRLQLSRLQSVDVVQPLIARLFGLAEVRIEVAGTGDSRASLKYLPYSTAQGLRTEVVARAAGLRPEAGEAPQTVLVQVPTADLIKSLILRGVTVFLVLLTIALVVFLTLTAGWGGLFLILLSGVPVLIVFGEFTNFYNFTVARSPDGLRLKAGLFSVTSQTVPPGRVQAVEFVQSWLWRRHDWVRVQLNIAGAVGAQDDQQNNKGLNGTILLPVAPYPVAADLVRLIMPGVDLDKIDMRPAPRRANKRAWIQHDHLSVGFDDQVFVTKRGRFVRRTAVVPHARTQSVRVTQGPWERSLGLASMHADSPPGPVEITALYRDQNEARELAEEQAQRALAAAHAEPTQPKPPDPATDLNFPPPDPQTRSD